MKSISKELNIFEEYPCYENISPQKKAWITIKSKQRNLDPIKVHAGIKAHFTKITDYIIILQIKMIGFGCCGTSMVNYHDVVIGKTEKDCRKKIEKLYDELLVGREEDLEYQEAIDDKEKNIDLLMEWEEIEVLSAEIRIINDDEQTTIHF